MKKKDILIEELQQEILYLKGQLSLTKMNDTKIINDLIASRAHEIQKLLDNPILTFPDGSQLQFSALNDEQFSFLNSLANKQNKGPKTL